MVRGEAAWAVTDSIKVLMDGPRTAQRPALTAVPCLRSCESRLCIMAHMVRCATVSALSCGAPCVTDVVYYVALLGARAPSARPRRRPGANDTKIEIEYQRRCISSMMCTETCMLLRTRALPLDEPNLRCITVSSPPAGRAERARPRTQRNGKRDSMDHRTAPGRPRPQNTAPQRIHTSVPLVAQWAGTWAMLSSRAREQSSAADAPVPALIPQFLERFNHHD